MEVAPNFDPIFWQLGRLAGAAVMSVAMMCGMVGVPSALAHVDAKLAARNACSRKFEQTTNVYVRMCACLCGRERVRVRVRVCVCVCVCVLVCG